jgi:multidrug resistance efflux pump
MTTPRRLKPVVYLLGLVLGVGTLVGVWALTPGRGHAQPDASNTSAKAGGPVVMGTVDSDPPPVPYGLPPVIQSGTVAHVFVKDGQEVKAGDDLYQFDTSLQQRKLDQAIVSIEQAKNEVDKAKEAKKQHEKKIAVAEQAVKAATDKETAATQLYGLIKANTEKGLKSNNIPEAEWPEKLKNNAELFKANADWLDARNLKERLQAELDLLKTSNVDLLVKQAEIAVELAEKVRAEAQTAVDLCTVKAKTAGTVEQVKVSAGATMGVSTRDPALWLVPAGPRIVRAEIEAEFAHRVSDSLKGKEVTIMDHTDPKLTYKGRVRQIGGTFLPKRTEGFLTNETRVIEAIVEVSDTAPAGKPPLRVGQRVRVNLGQ